jgi:hypothetical protein
MYDFTEEEYDMMAAGDFYQSIPNLPLEVLEQVKMKIEVELRERDMFIQENA